MVPARSRLLMTCLVAVCAFVVLVPSGAAAVVIPISDSSPWVFPAQVTAPGPTNVFQWQNGSQGTHRIVGLAPPFLPTTNSLLFLFDTGLLLPTQTSTPPVTLTTGNYRYICLIHPYISGSIRVQTGGIPVAPFTTPDIFQSLDTPPDPLFLGAGVGIGEVCVSQQFETPMTGGISGVVHCTDAESRQDLSLAAFSGNPAASLRTLAFPTDTSTPGLNGRKIGGRFEDLNNTHGLWFDRTGQKMFVAEWHGGQFHTIDRMTNTLAVTTPLFTGADVAHIITTLPQEIVGILSLEGGVSGSLGVFDPVTSAMTGTFNFGPTLHPHGMWVTCSGGGNGGGILITAFPMSNAVGFVNVPGTPTGPTTLRNITTSPGLYPFHVGARSDCTKAYVPNSFSDTVGVYDVPSGNALLPVVLPPCLTCLYLGTLQPVLPVPVDVAVSPDNLCAMATLSKAGQVAGIDPSTDTVVLPLVDCGNGCHGITFGLRKGGGFFWYASNTYQNKIKVGEVLAGCVPSLDGDILLNVSSVLTLQGLNTTGMGFNTPLPPLNRGGGTGIVSFPIPPPWHLGINVIN